MEHGRRYPVLSNGAMTRRPGSPALCPSGSQKLGRAAVSDLDACVGARGHPPPVLQRGGPSPRRSARTLDDAGPGAPKWR